MGDEVIQAIVCSCCLMNVYACNRGLRYSNRKQHIEAPVCGLERVFRVIIGRESRDVNIYQKYIYVCWNVVCDLKMSVHRATSLVLLL